MGFASNPNGGRVKTRMVRKGVVSAFRRTQVRLKPDPTSW